MLTFNVTALECGAGLCLPQMKAVTHPSCSLAWFCAHAASAPLCLLLSGTGLLSYRHQHGPEV